jgi:hypothetical protein
MLLLLKIVHEIIKKQASTASFCETGKRKVFHLFCSGINFSSEGTCDFFLGVEMLFGLAFHWKFIAVRVVQLLLVFLHRNLFGLIYPTTVDTDLH